MKTYNLVLFVTEAVFYFTVMVAFLHFRKRLGLGVFLTGLGVMHFMETYLAAVFYVELPFGTVSPGSSVLFAGKLMLILLLYIKEDAEIVRQPIYGLFLGNLMTVAVGMMLRLHDVTEMTAGGEVHFLRDMGWLMVWGTTLLYLDSIGIILLYERLGRHLPRHPVLRFLLCGLVMLSFDQIAFFGVLHVFFDVPVSAFWGGWQAKMLAVCIYSTIFLLYSRLRLGGGDYAAVRPLADVFGDLTFRERYEDLLQRSGRDTLTGLFDRNRMELEGPATVRDGLGAGSAVSVIILDVDHFKAVNDGFGHLQGDTVLKALAALLRTTVRAEDLLYRFGGEEFVVVSPRLDHPEAMALAERLRRTAAATLTTPDGMPVTISCGVASGPEDGAQFSDLVSCADDRLYDAKESGRNCVRGRFVSTMDESAGA